MNSGFLMFSCCLCQRNIPASVVVQFPCCNPSPHFCYDCMMTNQQGTHCQVCGELWSLPEILALFKQSKARQQHNRNRSEVGPNKVGNKLLMQSGYNRSYEQSQNPQIQNIPNGGAFVNEDFLELIKREIRDGSQQERKSFFKDPFALPAKQNFFAQNYPNNPLNGNSFQSTRPSTFQDEIDEFYSQKQPKMKQSMLNSVVTRDIPNYSPFNTRSNPFPLNFQNQETNNNNNPNLNFMSSAPEKFQNSMGYYDTSNPYQRNFNNFNSVQFPPESMSKPQFHETFDPKINMRFNNNMNEAEFMQRAPENINRMNINNNANSDAMAIEPENIPEMGFLNLNAGQNEENPSQNQTQMIHINNVNIQNAALSSQFTYMPQHFTTPSQGQQVSNVPKNFFNQSADTDKMRGSHRFGMSSPFPDNRIEIRKSVSPIRNSKTVFEGANLTPKNMQKSQKMNQNWQRFDNMETNKKFNEEFKMRAGLFDNS